MARKMTEWPSKRGGDTVPLAVGKWYDFHEFGWYMGNVGYYKWSKEFLEAGKRRLAGDTARSASTGEVKALRQEARELKEVVAEQTWNSGLKQIWTYLNTATKRANCCLPYYAIQNSRMLLL